MHIRFADYTLDDDRYLLERAGERVTLRPKVFDLLVYLIRHRERVVRREELVSELWDHVAVGDGALSGLVTELRQALGERGRGPSSIRTVHARGYQFVTPVEPVAKTHAEAEGQDAPREPTGGLDAIGRLIETVAERGSAGVIIQSHESHESREAAGVGQDRWLAGEGQSRLLAELLDRAEQTGFEVHRLVAPDESQISPARFARQVIESMITRRGRSVVCAALPLPARRWLEDEVVDRVAGGSSWTGAGPPDPLGAVAALLRALSCRRPLVILLEDLARAGGRFAADLLKVMGRLSQAPELDLSLRQLGLAPLPEPLFEALAAHVCGEEAGFSAIAEWAASAGGMRSGEAGAAPGQDSTARAHPERAAGPPMRRVEPAARRLGLRSIRS